jgi:hypothetical protein
MTGQVDETRGRRPGVRGQIRTAVENGLQRRPRRAKSAETFLTLIVPVVVLMLSACGGESNEAQTAAGSAPAAATGSVPQSVPMGGAKSVTTFFITSAGVGRGGDLGGLAGADAHCQALAIAEGSGDHTFRAYLSTMATPAAPAVNARDRIGTGPWYNAEGFLVAANLDQLHGAESRINKETAVTEKLDRVNGVGDTPNVHDMLTGSRSDGTAFATGEDLTCGNWTSSSGGRAQVGHHDRMGQGPGAGSWSSAHASRGCSQQDLQATGGAGFFYCFGID